MNLEFLNPEGMHKNPAFSQAVAVSGSGRLLFIGGQNAVDEQGQVVGVGDLAEQTRQVLRNLKLVLEAAGADPSNVFKWNIYLVAGQDFLAGFRVFQQEWPQSAHPPAISGIQVAGLAHPDFLIEIEAIAAISG